MDPTTFSGEPTTCRNIKNLKSLVFNLAGKLLPAHQSLIKQRFDDILPHQLFVPDHPPYSDMILTAMWELNKDGASSEEAISDFIKKENHELPWAHSTILSHHLRDLQIKGKITMTHDKCYVRCPLISKPIARSDSRCPSPLPSSSSSSSASLCSSPSSSSTSICWFPPHQTHERKRKRRRRNIKGKEGVNVQVRSRGRGRGRGTGRGRGRPPLIRQAGQRGSSRGSIRGRKRGRLSKEVKIVEESRIEEEDVDVDDVEEPTWEAEDQNEARGTEVEEDAIRNDELGQEDEAEKRSRGRIRGRKRGRLCKEVNIGGESRIEEERVDDDDVEEPIRETENQNEVRGMEVKDDVIPIAKHGQEDESEKQECSRGAIPGRKRGRLCKEGQIGGESQIEEEHVDDDDVEEPIRETEDQNEVRGVEVEDDSIPIDEHGQEDGDEKQENQSQKQSNAVVETGVLVEDRNEVVTGQNGGKEWVGNVHEKEENMVPRRSRRKKIVVSDEENGPQKQYNVTWIGRGVRKLKEDGRDVLEDDVSEEEVVVKMDSDAEVDEYVERLEQTEEKGAIIGECNLPEHNQQSDIVEKDVLGEERLTSVVERQDDTEEQPKKDNEEENKTCEQQKGIGTDKNMVEMEAVVKMEEEEQNDYLTEKQVDKAEQSEEVHDDVTEEPIHPQEQCVEKTEDSLQSCEQSQLKNGDPDSTEEQPQQKDQQTEENRRAIVLTVADIQQTEISTLQDKNNENSASSYSTNSLDHKHQDGHIRTLRQGLRSSSKKQETTPKSKKQVEQVTPVRRSLRSREIISEPAVITEKVPDHSKEQIKPPGRASSSRREPKIAEAEQVSTSRKTRSSGL